jgi:pyruvate carboxylase
VRQKADRANPKHVGAPMPGQVLKVNVKAGGAIRGGDVLLVTEAMKMETNVKLKADAVVAEILVKDGDKIEKDDLVAVLA